MNNSLNNADVIALANSYLSHVNVIVTSATLLIAVFAILVTYFYNRDKKQVIKEITSNILDKISQDEQLRNDFVDKILKNKDLKNELKKMVDLFFDDKINLKEKKEQEKTKMGGLE